MNFSNFFNNWLYANDGYYSNFKAIGKDGDFFTAVSSSSFFGGSIASRILDSIKEGFLSENSTILEIGAHRGYLLADIIQFIYTLEPNLLKTLKFAILEPFVSLQEVQKKYFYESFGDSIELNHYRYFNELKDDSYFIVANEILDAFPCELIYRDKMAIVNNFKIEFTKPLEPKVEELKNRYQIERGEIAVGFDTFAKSLSEVKKFEFVTFDYGSLHHRDDFSIRIYSNHQTYPLFEDELELEFHYKTSDITYDVAFNHIIDEFEKVGIEKLELKTQMSALINFGLLNLLEMLKAKSGESIYLQELNRVKSLIEPSIMGERFKMLRVRK
jgi:SAM-dependent MidA family methyltransferase